MVSALMYLMFLILPVTALCTLLVSGGLLLAAKHANKTEPGSYTDAQIKRYKLIATVSGVITGVFAIILLGIVGLLYMVVAFM